MATEFTKSKEDRRKSHRVKAIGSSRVRRKGRE
jgi:hypothetical protein